MPRWCRIHFLLFAAQLDGLKITTSSKNNNKSKKKKKISPIPHQHNNRLFTFCCFQVYVVVCIKKCVIGRHFQKTERRQRRIIGVRLIGFGLDDEICHNFTPHRTVTRRVDEQLSRDERFSRIMSACKHHTQAQHTNNHDTRLHNTFSFFFFNSNFHQRVALLELSIRQQKNEEIRD